MGTNLLTEMFNDTVKNYGSKEALASKINGIYTPLSYNEFEEKIRSLSYYLIDQGIRKDDRVALMSENCPQWAISDFGIIFCGGINVPIYPTLTANQVKYILNDSETKIIFLSNETHLKKVLEIFKEVPSLKLIITWGEYNLSIPEGINIINFNTALKEGLKLEEKHKTERENRLKMFKEDDVVSIIYTSGTTAEPKGVMLTHKNFYSNATVSAEFLKLTSKDIDLSFLPLSHVLERIAYYACIYKGGSIYYVESLDTISQNLIEVHPTIMVSVPRLLEKIRTRVINKVEEGSSLKKKIFYWGLKIGKQVLDLKQENKNVPVLLNFQYKLADKIVFSKIREKTGGKLRLVVSGGAPLSKEIGEFFSIVGLNICEGYGLTESSPVITINPIEKPKFGTVGKPITGVEVKIAEDGEILARGPNIMKGYYKKPEETAEAIDKDGWLHTGDIGFIDKDGYLTITDRKKEIFVMSNGKNVAPQPLENALKMSNYIEQAVVIGNNYNFISALIYPNYENLRKYAESIGLNLTKKEEFENNEKIQKLITEEIDRLTENFARFEKIKKFKFLPNELTQEGGELTPTLKYKRRIIHEKYKSLINSIYSDTL